MKKIKKTLFFHAYGQISPNIKNISYLIFIQNKIKKINLLACILGFNNQFIKIMRIRPIFQKYQKNILFSFSIWNYKFIRKMYS